MTFCALNFKPVKAAASNFREFLTRLIYFCWLLCCCWWLLLAWYCWLLSYLYNLLGHSTPKEYIRLWRFPLSIRQLYCSTREFMVHTRRYSVHSASYVVRNSDEEASTRSFKLYGFFKLKKSWRILLYF